MMAELACHTLRPTTRPASVETVMHTLLPAVFVFLLAQKHYIKGIAAGAVKG